MQPQFQYRVSKYMYMLGMVVEPAIYLVVWRTIVDQTGASGGLTAGALAAYYIVWTLVRNMNIVFTPYGGRPHSEGDSPATCAPVHPIHYDLGFVRWVEGGPWITFWNSRSPPC